VDEGRRQKKEEKRRVDHMTKQGENKMGLQQKVGRREQEGLKEKAVTKRKRALVI